MFFNEAEQQLSSEFIDKGYIIRPVADQEALDWIRNQFLNLVQKSLGPEIGLDIDAVLNSIHLKVPQEKLNSFRLEMIRGLNSIEGFRERYYRVARPYLEMLVGNELAMQLRVNLSIQCPDDESSLLSIHADTWSGDSPFEVVVWLPLVDCFGTKAMYILGPKEAADLSQNFTSMAGQSGEDLYQSIKNEIKWLNVKFGEVLVFDQGLPHGNRVNEEGETRWSMNCRFKGVFTPYGDKKLGEFFEPITLKPISRIGMNYQLPKLT
jgi:sporadic carbohydrate cluster 2OG-Fe(II) oxygenase